MVEFNLMLEYSLIFGALLFDLSGAETRILQSSCVNTVVLERNASLNHKEGSKYLCTLPRVETVK